MERVQELTKALQNKSGKLHGLQCDITKQEDIEKCFKWIKDHVGPVQILVNNAGLVKTGTLIGKNTSYVQDVECVSNRVGLHE